LLGDLYCAPKILLAIAFCSSVGLDVVEIGANTNDGAERLFGNSATLLM
jgi:hypothetical protein